MSAIYLLDLNFTLVANSLDKRTAEQRRLSYAQKIERELYRDWLVELLRGKTVLLCTVREQQYEQQTLARIKALTGWQPTASYFNPTPGMWLGAVVKRAYLLESIFPQYGFPGLITYYGIESSIKTRAMYKSLGIDAEPQENIARDGLPLF